MKVLFALVFALFMTSASAESRNIEWVKIAAMSDEVVVVYVDYSSFESMTDADGTYTAVALLVHRPEPVHMDFGIGNVEITSLIRWLFIDCKNGNMFPMREFYFNQKTLPKSGDNTVGSIFHDPKTASIKNISKENPVRVIMCPETDQS